MKRIAVIGGGIAGLAAAYRLCELQKEKSLDLEVILFEAGARLGGSIATEKIDDFLIEAGPDSFITEKPAALQLCQRLGLTPRLVSTQSANQKIHVVRSGKLVELPEGFFLLAPTQLGSFLGTSLFSWPGKLRMAAELFLPRGENDGDESLGSFVRRRFGREALERVAQPLVGGIYASDPEQLSLTATMPRFKDLERQYRSVTYGMWSAQRARAQNRESGSGARWSLFVTLEGGMQELVDALAKQLAKNSVRLNSAAEKLSEDKTTSGWRLELKTGEVVAADAVVLATPAFQTSAILKTLASDAANELGRISYASTATISLAYRRENLSRLPKSFGFVVPAIENRKIMACTFSSLKYPGRAPEGHVLLRAFIGGSLQPELFKQDDESMENNVRNELAKLLGVTAKPLLSRIWRHANSMPQYHIGHIERIKKIENLLGRFSNLTLAGSAYHGVGISDCVSTGKKAAESLVSYFARNAAAI